MKKVLALSAFCSVILCSNFSYAQFYAVARLIMKNGNEILEFRQTGRLIQVNDETFINSVRSQMNKSGVKTAIINSEKNIPLSYEDTGDPRYPTKQWIRENPKEVARKKKEMDGMRRFMDELYFDPPAMTKTKVRSETHEQLMIRIKRIIKIEADKQTTLKGLDNVDIYLSIPKNSVEYKNIFKVLNQKQLADTKYIYDKINKEKSEQVYFSNSLRDFLTFLSTTDNKKPVILIGHNTKGQFYFPDGSSASFNLLDSVAQQNKKVIAYLSCNAYEYTNNPSTKHSLTYREAIFISKRLNDSYLLFTNKNKQNTKQIFNDIMNSYAQERSISDQYRIVGVGTVLVGIGFGIYIIEKKPEPRPIKKIKIG